MRRIVDEVVWVTATYHFDSRMHMYRALAAARRLLVLEGARAPLQITCKVVGEATVEMLLKIPMFEEHEYAASLVGLLRHAARHRAVEAHVDVA